MNELSPTSPTKTHAHLKHGLAAADPWVTSSLLHKAVRRGDSTLAVAAARRFMHLRRSAIWRRLMVIAFEDIGAAGPDLLIALTCAASNRQGRALTADDVSTILDLVHAMAESPKERGADYLISAVRLHPALEVERERSGSSSLANRLDFVADEGLPLVSRALAAWYAAGVDCPGECQLGVGNIIALLDNFRTLGVPADLLSSTKVAVDRTREPICLMVPLVWHAAHAAGTPSVVHGLLPASPVVNEVPMYAFDCHTQIGKAAARRFARENPTMQDWIETYVDLH